MVISRQAMRQAARLELAVRHPDEWVRWGWPLVEPARLEWSWHLGLMAREIDDAIQARDGRRLVVCVPPGSAKSLIGAVLVPSLAWARDPSLRLLVLSSGDRAAARDARRMRSLVRSPEYAQVVAHQHEQRGLPLWGLAADQAEKRDYATTAGGGRMTLTLRGGVTGLRGDVLIIDDPVQAKEATLGTPQQIRHRMEEACDLVEQVCSTRLNDARTAAQILIMQRLHPDDPAGLWIRNGARALVLPAIYPGADRPPPGGLHPDDPREAGQALSPRFQGEAAARTRASLGVHAAGQLDQQPSPPDGSVFRLQGFQRRYVGAGEAQRIRAGASDVLQAIDTALGANGDWWVSQVWCRSGTDLVLLDQIRVRCELHQFLPLVVEQYRYWRPDHCAIERAAAGVPLAPQLADAGLTVVQVRPVASKVERAQTSSALCYEAGRVLLPGDAPWLADYISEHLSFPSGQHDDQVDATSLALARLMRM